MLELGLLFLLLLSRAQKAVFSPTDAAAEAAKKKKEAEQLAAEARAAAARGEAEKARQKAAEAQAKHQQGTAMEQAAKTPVPWPQALPGDLPPFPAGWAPASPVTAAMVTRAFQLLPVLWTRGAGNWTAEKTGAQWVVYQAQQMGEKKGVVAFTPKLGAATVKPAATPARPAPAPAAAPARSPGIVPVSAPAAKPTGLPLLFLTMPRMKGPSVIALQQRLAIAATGQFDPATDAAVRKFQANNFSLDADGVRRPLKVDGKVGDKTWKALGFGGAAKAA